MTAQEKENGVWTAVYDSITVSLGLETVSDYEDQ